MDLVNDKLTSEEGYLDNFEQFKKRISLFVEERNHQYGNVVEPVFICSKEPATVKDIVFQMAKKLN